MKLVNPWHWRKLPLVNRSGSEIFAALFLNSPLAANNNCYQKIATLLESPSDLRCNPLTRYSLCAGSPRYFQGKYCLFTPKLGQVLLFLRDLLSQKTADLENFIPTNLPFVGGWLGWLSYDVAWEIENLPNYNLDTLPFPVAYWYEPDNFAVLDHQEQILWLAASQPEYLDWMESQLQLIQSNPPFKKNISGKIEPLVPLFHQSQTEYETAVKQAQKYIYIGDIFQTNLSLRFQAETCSKSWSIYQALQHINPSPFASYWRTPWGSVISCSPERLVNLQGKKIQTRPIAGTRKRGKNQEEEQKLEQELITNKKERAEHIMLVDLERNDLGRVSEWGSVQVNELLTIEKYSHVMHLVSNVIGTLSPNCDAVDLIKGVFPGGTITGCPKVRCLEIIEELEPVKRNLFYGSCGYLDQRGNLDLNILIRTLLYCPNYNHNKATVWGQVGAGIVADSDPEKEWFESLQKAQAQLQALTLAE